MINKSLKNNAIIATQGATVISEAIIVNDLQMKRQQ